MDSKRTHNPTLILALVLALFGAGVFAGCAKRQPSPSSDKSTIAIDGPYSLIIEQESYDGHLLVVDGELSKLEDGAPDSVVVRLSTFNNGEPVDRISKELNLKKAQGKFRMLAPSASATDYQLELFWGKGRGAVEPVRAHGLVVAKQKYANGNLDLVLENLGPSLVKSATLSLDLNPVDGMFTAIQESVELPHLNLKPGEHKTVSIEVDLSQAGVVEFQPLAKISKYE